MSTNEELVAEAERLLAENQWTSGWGVESLAERLAKALEQTTRELTEERDTVAKVREYAESIPRTRDRDVNPRLSERSWLTARDVLAILDESASRPAPVEEREPSISERLAPKRPAREPAAAPAPIEAGEHEAMSGRRLILIQKARAEANYYRAFDDTEDLVGVLVEMAIMLEKDARRAPIEDAERFAQTPAIREVIDTLDFVADRMDEHAYGEIRSAVESIPECETYTAVAHDEHEVEAGERSTCVECGGSGMTGSNYMNSGTCESCGGSGVEAGEREALAERIASVPSSDGYYIGDAHARAIADAILAAVFRRIEMKEK